MWIERLEFIGFGNLTGQRIEFAPNKLSVVVQPNEYGKSTISEAIWAILYGYDKEDGSEDPRVVLARKPLSGASFKACLDLKIDDKNIRLIRNFNDQTLKVLDLDKDPSKADSDVTNQYKDNGGREFGEMFTGLSRRLFRTACFVRQRQLDRSPFSNDRALSSLLLSIADSGGATSNVFDAMGVLEQKLAKFPFRGKEFKIDELVTSLEAQRHRLAENLERIESERQSCDRDVERLSEVDERLSARMRVVSADEYFHLCLEAADLDNRLSKAQERYSRVCELQTQLADLAWYETFPIDQHKQIQEMWLRRQSRIGDIQRLESELKEKQIQAHIEDLEYRERTEGLEQFNIDDMQMISSLGRNLQQVEKELDEVRRQYAAEHEHIRKLGVNVDQFVDLRKSLLILEPRELDELHALNTMAVASRERTSECLLSADKAQTTALEIRQGRTELYNTVQKFFWPCLVLACLCLVPLMIMLAVEHRGLSDNVVDLVLLVYIIFCAGAGIAWFMASRIKGSYRILDEQNATADARKYQNMGEELSTKLLTYESKIEEYARKARVSSGAELVHNVQEYAVYAPQFKELDFLEKLLNNRETQVTKLRAEIKPYFVQAKRTPEKVTGDDALLLAEDIGYLVDAGRKAGIADFSDFRISQIRFLADEMKDADSKIHDQFSRMGLTFSTLEEGYQRFVEATEGFRRYEALKNELERITDDSSMDSLPSEMPKVIERLEAKRNDLYGRMQQLIASNPAIMQMPPPTGESTVSSLGKEMADLKNTVDALRRERDDLTVQIRAAMKNYQDNYLKTMQELEAVERDLEHVRHTRASLRLARDTFQRLADENHSVWADKLTDIARDMLKHLGTEYETIEFDADMHIKVRRKGQREALDEWQVQNQLSAGTKEQLHCLARVAVLRFLSQGKPLPIILDEPFSEFDDERFVKIMRFLLNTICTNHQVIIFSCHQQRHEWLLDQLDPRERQSIELCRLSALKSDTGALTRR